MCGGRWRRMGGLLLGAMEEAEEAAEWFVAESLGDGYVYRPIAS